MELLGKLLYHKTIVKVEYVNGHLRRFLFSDGSGVEFQARVHDKYSDTLIVDAEYMQSHGES